MRTDPTGKWVWLLVNAIIGGISSEANGGNFWSGFGIGAITGGIGAGVNTVLSSAFNMTAGALSTNILSGAIAGGITNKGFGGDFWKGAGQGALGGAVSWGVNQCIGGTLAKWAGNDQVKITLASGFKGAVGAGLNGGDIGKGFAYSAASSIGGSIANKYYPKISSG
jgi:hypothetical protein